MILRKGKRLTIRDMTVADIDVWANWRRPGHEWQKLDAPYSQDNPTEQELASNPEPA